MAAGEQDVEQPGAAPLRRVGEWLRAPSTIAAAALVLVGLAFVYLEGQSVTRLYWTGRTTSGTLRDGLVYYRVHGQIYTIDTDKPAARPTPITVYYRPSDPSQAIYDTPTRWVEGGTMLVWFVAAAACLVIAPLRQRRRRHRVGSEPSWVHAYVQQRSQPPPP